MSIRPKQAMAKAELPSTYRLIRSQGRLVTDGAGSAAKEGGHLGASLRKAKDVVNEEEHVLMLLVAEILGDREAGKGYAQAGARGFVHLSIHQSDLRLIDVRGGTSR